MTLQDDRSLQLASTDVTTKETGSNNDETPDELTTIKAPADSNDIEESTADDNVTENFNAPKKLTTLADLINVCRDRGLQVFNDKPNVPEADKLWMNAKHGIRRSQRHSDYQSSSAYESPRGHRSVSHRSRVDTRSRHTRSKHSRHSKKSRRSSRWRGMEQYPDSVSTTRKNQFSEDSYGDLETITTRDKSSVSMRYGAPRYRSSAGTRLDTLTVDSSRHKLSASSRRETVTRSSVLSILDMYDDSADIDAEEVLKLRMRRKCKRRKESIATIGEMLHQKHKEIETLAQTLQTINDFGEKNENYQTKSLNNEIDNSNIDKNGHCSVQSRTSNNLENVNGNSFVNSGDCIPAASATNGKSLEDTATNIHQDVEKEAILEQLPQTLSDAQGNAQEPLNTSGYVSVSTPDGEEIEAAENNTPNNSCKSRNEEKDAQGYNKASDEQTGNQKLQEIHIQDGNTTLILYGVTALPHNDSRPHSAHSISQDSLNRNETIIPNDPFHESGSKNVDQGNSAQECHDVPIHSKYGTSDPNENIKVNESISQGSKDSKGENEEENTDANDYLMKTNTSASGSPSVVSLRYDMKIEAINQNDGEEINTKSPSASQKLCHDGLNGSQCDFNLPCEKQSFNNSTDENSDKNTQITNMRHQTKIDGNITFQVVDNPETDVNNLRLNETFNKLGNTKEPTSDHLEESVKERKQNVIRVSLDADNLIVETESENFTSSYSPTIMETPPRNNSERKGDVQYKKSYGNGFLVSGGDSQNDIDSDIKENNRSDGSSKQTSDSRDSKVNGKSNGTREYSTEGTAAESDTSDRQSRHRQSIASSDVGRYSKSSVSSAGTPFKKIHGAARLMVLMAQLKKTYEAEELTQQSFLQEIGSTRKALRSNYRKLQNGEEIEIESPRHEGKSNQSSSIREDESEVSIPLTTKDITESHQTTTDKTDNITEHEIRDSVRSADLKSPIQQNDDSDQVSYTEIREENQNNANTSNTNKNSQGIRNNEDISKNEHQFRKHFLEPQNQNENIKNAKPKVDSHWDQDSQVYQQIKNGFNSKLVIPDSSGITNELNKLKNIKFETGYVYIEDARQRCKQRSRKANQTGVMVQSNEVSRPKTEKAKPLDSEDETNRVINPKRPYTDGQRIQTPHLKKIDLGNSKTVFNRGRNTARKPSQNEGSVSRIPVRTKAYERTQNRVKQNKTDFDSQRLERDKRKINEYQEYIESQGDLPNIEAPNIKFRKYKFRTNKISCDSRKIQEIKFDSNDGFAGNESPHTVQSRNKKLATKRFDYEEDYSQNNTRDEDYVSALNSPDDTIKLNGISSTESTNSLHRSKVPIGKAVEIARSRSQFYENNVKDKSIPRELRILRLFEELQKLKYGRQYNQEATNVNKSALSMDTSSRPSTRTRNFLVMNYEVALKCKSDMELNRFLYEALDYEVCSRGKHLYKQTNNKEKALQNLRAAFYNNSFQASHKAR